LNRSVRVKRGVSREEKREERRKENGSP